MIKQKENNVELSITVKPNSGKFAIEEKGGELIVRLESKPVENKANIELIKAFKHILKKEVSLVSGEKSKRKKIAIFNSIESEIRSALKRASFKN